MRILDLRPFALAAWYALLFVFAIELVAGTISPVDTTVSSVGSFGPAVPIAGVFLFLPLFASVAVEIRRDLRWRPALGIRGFSALLLVLLMILLALGAGYAVSAGAVFAALVLVGRLGDPLPCVVGIGLLSLCPLLLMAWLRAEADFFAMASYACFAVAAAAEIALAWRPAPPSEPLTDAHAQHHT